MSTIRAGRGRSGPFRPPPTRCPRGKPSCSPVRSSPSCSSRALPRQLMIRDPPPDFRPAKTPQTPRLHSKAAECTEGPRRARRADPAPKGFRVELIYSVPRQTQGSWVNMTVDPKGRLIVSDQYGKLYRVTLPPISGKADGSARRADRRPDRRGPGVALGVR